MDIVQKVASDRLGMLGRSTQWRLQGASLMAARCYGRPLANYSLDWCGKQRTLERRHWPALQGVGRWKEEGV